MTRRSGWSAPSHSTRTYPDALYALGQLYMRAGEKEKGVETLKRFREVKAKAPTTRR